MALGAIVALGAGGAAHAQDGERIPAWVKTVFEFYVDGQISEGELINALQYLIEQNIIQVAAPAASGGPPAMSAEATSYNLQAEALEQASVESRMAMIEIMSYIPMGSEYLEPAEYEALQEQAARLQELATAMDTADAAHINAMRGAAADGTVTAAEQAGIEAAAAAAVRATAAVNDATLEITPALQQVVLATTMGALAGP